MRYEDRPHKENEDGQVRLRKQDPSVWILPFLYLNFFFNLVQRVLSDSVCRLSFLREVTLQKVSRMNFPLFLLHGVSAY